MKNYLQSVSRSRLPGLIFLVLALGAAVLILIQGGAQLVTQSIRLNPLLVILSFVVSCLAFLFQVAAWRRILAGFGVQLSAREDLRIYSYAALGVAVPGGIWSIVGRSTLYSRLGANSLRVATAGVVEAFVIGIAALGVYALTVFVQPGINIWQRPEVGFGFAVLVLLLIQPRVFNRLSSWVLERSGQSKELLQVAFSGRTLAGWIAIEAGGVVVGGLSVFVLLNSLIAVPASVVVVVIAAWAAAMAISTLFFWLPGTLFLRDGAMILALASDLLLPVALVFVVLVRFWSIASLLVVAGAAWLFLDRPYRTTPSEKRSR